MRALIIDDSKTMRHILRRTLVELGFEVEEACDGLAAVAILGQHAFEVAFVDWSMPNMNGFELVQAVRRNTAWSDVKLVMVTTESNAHRIQSALEAGADEYIMKPFTPDMLMDKLSMIGVAP